MGLEDIKTRDLEDTKSPQLEALAILTHPYLNKAIKYMQIIGVESENCSNNWRGLSMFCDTTFNEHAVFISGDGADKADNLGAYTIGYRRLSPAEMLEKLKNGRGSDRLEDKFLRERINYWLDYYTGLSKQDKFLAWISYMSQKARLRV